MVEAGMYLICMVRQYTFGMQLGISMIYLMYFWPWHSPAGQGLKPDPFKADPPEMTYK